MFSNLLSWPANPKVFIIWHFIYILLTSPIYSQKERDDFPRNSSSKKKKLRSLWYNNIKVRKSRNKCLMSYTMNLKFL